MFDTFVYTGGIGMVLESEEGANRRHAAAVSKAAIDGQVITRAPFRCRLLGTLISNSAYHGASLDRKHIGNDFTCEICLNIYNLIKLNRSKGEEMERFISSIERERGISRSEIARHGVYFSHETSTHASPTASCASNEVL
jgi:hypothetical protein